jgi:predicted aspartyl protease
MKAPSLVLVMPGRLPPFRFALLIIPVLCLLASGSSEDAELSHAGQLYEAGKFAEAQAAYEAVLKVNAGSAHAEAGLVRSLLRQEKIDEAREIINKAIAAQANSAVLLSALGDVQFRFGEMGPAETSYLNAGKRDPKEVHAYLGLVDVYAAYSLYRHAYDLLQRAHDIAPDNVEVQRVWMSTLPRKQRLAALQAYLAGPHPDDQEETASLERYVAFLQATVDKQAHFCKLTGKVEQTETPLEMMGTPRIIHGVGLMVKLNGHGTRLLLDTGAGRILVTRHVAEKAGLTRLTAVQLGGIGDKGERSGYIAVADHIHIGDLEFHDCLVEVADKGLESEDGLIGADVFRMYLIDLDMPGMKLKLSPLPKRPDEASAETSLETRGDSGLAPDEESESSAEANSGNDKKGDGVPARAAPRVPHDRYVAPEMADWTKVFRFRHMLLVPTRVNDSRTTLFLIDTGAFSNLISTRAAREATKVHSDDRVRVHGLSGEVKQVYSADKFTLQFGRYRQKNQDAVSFDFSNLNKKIGTEVSGVLGFATWETMELKIDYRDGLVDFLYDPARVPAYNRR